MNEPIFDRGRLDVYRLAIDYVAYWYRNAKGLSGVHRHAREQWLRAAQSIPLNKAEGERQGPRRLPQGRSSSTSTSKAVLVLSEAVLVLSEAVLVLK